jgi:Holliday junction DNA helicase RuvA
MIITLTGTVAAKAVDYAVIECAGVGYQVWMSKPSLLVLPVGSETKVWTHEHVREDARDLFGFLTAGDQRLFEKLIGISGVGPKSALSILALGSAKQVEDAVERGDVAFLSSASGVGKKTAQKMILELKGCLVAGDGTDAGEEVLVALVSLGYDRERARAVLQKLGSDGAVEDRLRAALRELGR